MATPFVQGHLRDEELVIEATTQCAVTRQEIRLEIDTNLDYRVLSAGADPYVFEPHVDWQSFTAPSIIHDY